MIVVKITDGLGNQMFQYAFARTLQAGVSQKVYLDISDINNLQNDKKRNSGWMELCDRREYQLDNFLITLPIINIKKLPEVNRRIFERNKFLSYCKELRLLPTVYLKEADCNERGFKYTKYQNYYLEGYFFDKRYYENAWDMLRREFELKEKLWIPDDVNQILKSRNTTSIHIRRGDFLRVGRNISEGEYYNRAVEYLKANVRNPFLFIFSDDIEWVKGNMRFDLEHMFISGKGFSDCEELTLMSMCMNNIIANSTYSYWAAWLNRNKEKLVIAPRGWKQKIIPRSWVVL